MSIIVMSDLHVGDGPVAASSSPSGLELFHHDREFSRLLEHHQARAVRRGQALHVILLGDLFDFPRVTLESAAGSDEDRALAKLQRIIDAHPDVIESLCTMVTKGARVHVLPGNHDTELMNPRVRQVLTDAIDPGRSGLLQFHDWILHIPGVLYAEHGNQYHDINSFPAWLNFQAAFHSPKSGPVGPIFDEYLIGLARATKRDSVDFRLVRQSVTSGPGLLARTAPEHLRFAWRMGINLASLALNAGSRARNAYRNNQIAAAADLIGIPAQGLAEIDRMAEAVARRLPLRIARGVARIGRRRLPWVGQHRSGDVGHAVITTPGARTELVREIAARIHQELARTGHSVPFYVFGHTHFAADHPFVADKGSPRYLNPGSWSDPRPASEGGEPRFTYIEIESGDDGGPATARLLDWQTLRE